MLKKQKQIVDVEITCCTFLTTYLPKMSMKPASNPKNMTINLKNPRNFLQTHDMMLIFRGGGGERERERERELCNLKTGCMIDMTEFIIDGWHD